MARKGSTAKNKKFRKIKKTKRFTKQDDQIYRDMRPENLSKFQNQKLDEDLPGLGQFYCISCASYFVNLVALNQHVRTKSHKRRKKMLKVKPYDKKEAEFLNKY